MAYMLLEQQNTALTVLNEQQPGKAGSRIPLARARARARASECARIRPAVYQYVLTVDEASVLAA